MQKKKPRPNEGGVLAEVTQEGCGSWDTDSVALWVIRAGICPPEGEGSRHAVLSYLDKRVWLTFKVFSFLTLPTFPEL